MPKKNENNSAPVNLTDELMEKRDTIARLFVRANLEEAQSKYLIGVEVITIRSDPKRYGKESVAKIARAVSSTKALLYSYGKVAEAWNQKAFAALVDQKDLNGQPLSFSHFIALANVKDAKQRSRLMDRALAEGLSVRELTKECRPTKSNGNDKDLDSLRRTSTSVIKRADEDLQTLHKLVAAGALKAASGDTLKLFMEDCQRVQEKFKDLEQLATGLLVQPQKEAAE